MYGATSVEYSHTLRDVNPSVDEALGKQQWKSEPKACNGLRYRGTSPNRHQSTSLPQIIVYPLHYLKTPAAAASVCCMEHC